ncbi:MAG: hypothetical protein ACTHM6_12505, partial [Tepidisphaeraceae bacterium]
GEEDVTRYCTELQLDDVDATAIKSAVDTDRAKTPKPVRKSEQTQEPASDKQGGKMRSFDIPVTNGGLAKLICPVPLDKTDIARLKGYIDLLEDLLTCES